VNNNNLLISSYSKSIERCRTDWLNVTVHCKVKGKGASPYLSRRPLVKAMHLTLSALSEEVNGGEPLRRVACWGGSAIRKTPQHIHMLLEKPTQYRQDFNDRFEDYFKKSSKDVFNKRDIEPVIWHQDFIISEEMKVEHFISYIFRQENTLQGVDESKIIVDILLLN